MGIRLQSGAVRAGLSPGDGTEVSLHALNRTRASARSWKGDTCPAFSESQ